MASADIGKDDLGSFLRSRRARLNPADFGIPSYGQRRVPGLRREELAQLAGISPTYYMRLEQGHSTNASSSVIEALARALDLDADERTHLFDLARPAGERRRRAARAEHAAPSITRLMTAMSDVPAVVVGPRTEVLAWNVLGHALLAGHVAWDAPKSARSRPNLTRMLFLDAHTRELYREWHVEACRAVSSLRLVSARFADDPGLADLVGELTLRSDEFAGIWARHPVKDCVSGVKKFRHPSVGDLDLEFDVMHLGGLAGHRMIAYHAQPGTPAAAALSLLDALRAPVGPTAERRTDEDAPH